MRAGRAGSIIAAIAIIAATAALSAHRRDEYLQAARIAIAPARVIVQLDLTPGIAVADAIIHEIDRDGDDVLSPAEQQAYVNRVLSGIGVDVDRQRVYLQLVSSTFPDPAAFRRGEGTIQLQFDAPLPGVSDGMHRLTFRNMHHLTALR